MPTQPVRLRHMTVRYVSGAVRAAVAVVVCLGLLVSPLAQDLTYASWTTITIDGNGAAVFLEASFPRSAMGASANQVIGIDGETLASASFSSNVKDCIPGPATCSGMFSLDTSNGTVTVNAGDTTSANVACVSNPAV